MQSPSDHGAHSHPHPDPHPQPEAGGQALSHATGSASLFLAGSRERLMAASGVVALLWLLVWWALD